MKKRAFSFVILAGLFWGITGIMSTYLAKYGFTGLQSTAVRAATSFLLMLLYVLLFDRRALRTTFKEIVFFVGIGAALFGTSTAYFYAIPRTSNATAVVLMYTSPVMVAVVSSLFLGERFSKLKVVSVGTMLLGCLFVSGVIGDLRADFVGVFLGLLSAVSYATYNILTKIAMRRGSPAITVTVYSFGFMTLFSLLMCRPGEILSAASENPYPVIPLAVGIGLLTCVIPYVLYTAAMKTLSAGTACALSIVEPMSATVYCMLLFGQYPDFLSTIGIILILFAVFLLGKAQNGEIPEK